MSQKLYNLKIQNTQLLFRVYLIGILLITILLIFIRILFYFLNVNLFQENVVLNTLYINRDLNFKTNYFLMDQGLFHYYEVNPLFGDYGIYLYYWFFIFYPFYIIDINISMYLWDALRFIASIYISKKIYQITDESSDLAFFFFFSGIGYFFDMYLNNVNWLIQLLLSESYIQLKKNNKILSGILFTFSMFKVIPIFFLPIIILSRLIKVRDLLYYVAPLFLICIPYIIFPVYFFQLFTNWTLAGPYLGRKFHLDTIINLGLVIQMGQLMIISVLASIIIINIVNNKWKRRVRITSYLIIFNIWINFWLILFLIVIFI